MKQDIILVPDSILSVNDGQKVFAGDVLAVYLKQLLKQRYNRRFT